MGQEERRAKAVLAAAVAWRKTTQGNTSEADAASEALAEAVEAYEAVKSAEPPADPMAFMCPHCGAVRPQFGFHYNLGDTGPFALQWVTCFCAECKKIVGWSTVAFLPKPELAELLKAEFAGKIGLA